MPLSLSPYRYYQLAHYILRNWLEHAPKGSALWKGKGRAEPAIRDAIGGLQRQIDDGISRFSLEERRAVPDLASSGASPLAGPSSQRNHRYTPPTPYRRPSSPEPEYQRPQTEIYRLMHDERLLHPGSAAPPREVVVLCHGLYGFSTSTPIPLFPSLKLHYWAAVLGVLKDQMGVNVLVVGVKGTGSIKERAEQMHQFLKDQLPKGTGVNFVAHSMGGLDCRYLISKIKPTSYTPVSLTTIGTPHHGSPFMDWCAANIGVGSPTASEVVRQGAEAMTKALPYSLKAPILARTQESKVKKDGLANFTSSLTSYLLNIFDSPAYANLTTSYLRDHFNPSVPDSPSVKYTSVAGRINKLSVLHPLWFPKLVLDAGAENGYGEDVPGGLKAYEGNDGLVSIHSAQWGNYIGAVDGAHHWDLRGEGGLFPTTSSLRDEDDKKASSPKESNTTARRNGVPGPDGHGWLPTWDWQGDFGNSVSEHLGLAAEAAKSTVVGAVDKVRPGPGPGSGPSSPGQLKSPNSQPGANASSSSSWDLAQVGQVLDWVTDLIPGGDNAETKKKQLADAKREKEKDAERNERRLRLSNGNGNGSGTGGIEGKKVEKEKFDLAKFYGGLMLKLRDDGF